MYTHQPVLSRGDQVHLCPYGGFHYLIKGRPSLNGHASPYWGLVSSFFTSTDNRYTTVKTSNTWLIIPTPLSLSTHTL